MAAADELHISSTEVIAAYREQRKARKPGHRKVSADLAKGEVNRELAAALAENFSADEITLYLDELLSATHKGVPDNRTRLSALQLLMAYLFGKPIERSEVLSLSLDVDTAAGLDERLAKSPALREAMKKAIERAEMGDGSIAVETVPE